jgi:hypothetical protein
MINLASPGDLKRGFAIGSMRKSYIHVSYYKLYGQVQQSALNRRGSDNLHESLSGQCSTEASGRWTDNYRDRPLRVCNCV